MLDVSIYFYSDIIGYNNCQTSSHLLKKEIAFKVERDLWLYLVTLETEKVAKLLTYKQYKNNRASHTFPWQELKQLKQYRKANG